ncbi:hypothetical protein [Deinococcus wulumuqiensis]|nr:hypothetical protein [Deinococcus wulumuqiensis]
MTQGQPDDLSLQQQTVSNHAAQEQAGDVPGTPRGRNRRSAGWSCFST